MTNKKKKKIAKIKAKIETKKVLAADISQDHLKRLQESERRLNKISEIIPECIENLHSRYSIIYLLSGIFGLIMVYLTATEDLESKSNIILNLTGFTYFVILILTLQLKFKDKNFNTTFVVVSYCLGCIIISILAACKLLFVEINFINDKLLTHISNIVLLIPFILNFFITVLFDYELNNDIKKADKLSEDNGDLLKIYKFINKE